MQGTTLPQAKRAPSLQARPIRLTPRRALSAILLLFWLWTLAFNALIPLGEAPDEVSHFAVVRFLAHHGRWPTPADGVGGEIFQPPLYYLLAAPLTVWIPPGPSPVEANPDFEYAHPWRGLRLLIQRPESRWPWHGEALAWHLARLPSSLYGVITIIACYGLARCLCPHQRWVPLAVAAWVAFLPQFTFLSGVLNNDTLATMLGALLLWQLAYLATAPLPLPQARLGWALVGLLGGLSVWTKSSGWLFVGTTIAAAILWPSHHNPTARWAPPREQWARLWAAGGVWLLLGLPLWAFNWWRSGDILGWQILHHATDARETPLTLAQSWTLVAETARSFWAGFGGAAHLHLPAPLPLTLTLLLLGGLIGALALWRDPRSSPATRRLIAVLALHSGLIILGLAQWARTVLGTSQGRLLFPALPALAVLSVVGLYQLGTIARQRWRQANADDQAAPHHPWVAGAMVGASLALLMTAWVTVLRPAYWGVPPPMAPAPQLSWQIGAGLTLERLAFPWTVDSRIWPGQSTELYTQWHAQPGTPDTRLRLQLVNRDREPVWLKESTPTAGYMTTDHLARQGISIPGWHRVEIPYGTPPGYYRLFLAVVPTESESPLPIIAPDGTPLGEQVMIGQVTVIGAE